MSKVLLAGATGYLGGYILKELEHKNFETRVLARNPGKIEYFNSSKTEIVKSDVTNPESLQNVFDGVDIVISAVGITKQKDGLTYMDVDYGANLNLLNKAVEKGVKKFIYISAFNADKLKHLKICEAKEMFVDELKKSGINYCVIRPNGFFSDLTELYIMAEKGNVFLFGDGNFKVTPIHGEDLAEFCVASIEKDNKELNVGGPQTLTHNEIARLAFDAVGKKNKITYIPNWLRIFSLKILRTFTNSRTYGPLEFFMTVMSMDMDSPEYGSRTIKKYFDSLSNRVNEK